MKITPRPVPSFYFCLNGHKLFVNGYKHCPDCGAEMVSRIPYHKKLTHDY